jgi:Mn2+/Fe2+ NRAMP family transporter
MLEREETTPADLNSVPQRPTARFARLVGPGVVAGASDNDPTTVGAVSVVGATTGYTLSWLALLVFPMLAVVQVVATQVGAVTGADLVGLATKRYGRRWAVLLLASVLVVNVLTIAADLEAGAAALGLLTRMDWRWFVLPLGALLVGLMFAGTYHRVVVVLRYLLVGFVAYAASAVLAHPHWGAVLRATLVPSFSLERPVVTGAVAMLGTTLTSYVYLWQTISQAEESADRRSTPEALARAREDAVVGACFLVVTFWFILIASGATLGASHAPIATAEDAARALRPLAGPAAGTFFAVGLLGSALIALPVLAATTAYAVGSHFDWRRGLSAPIGEAKRFYLVLFSAVLLGAVLAVAGVSPIGILMAASIAGAFGTPVSLAFLLRLAQDPEVMGAQAVSHRLALAGWLVAAVITIFGLALLAITVWG